MLSSVIRLTTEDPTVFAKCPVCCKRGTDGRATKYYASSYPVRKWKKGPLCENCESPMVEVYSIDTEEQA